MPRITSFRDLEVYRAAVRAAMAILEATKRFPADERFSPSPCLLVSPSLPHLLVGRAFSGQPAFRPAWAFQPVRLRGKGQDRNRFEKRLPDRIPPHMAVVGRAFSGQPAFEPASASRPGISSPATLASACHPGSTAPTTPASQEKPV